MAIKGSFFKSKQADIAGAFKSGQAEAAEALEQDEDKESTQKPAVDEKSQAQTQTPNGGGHCPPANGGGGGGGKERRGLFARKEGGTRMGNLLRSIGSVFTKSKG